MDKAEILEDLHTEYRRFDPAPISDALVDGVLAQVPVQGDTASVKALSAEFVMLKASIAGIANSLFLGLIILAGLVLWRH